MPCIEQNSLFFAIHTVDHYVIYIFYIKNHYEIIKYNRNIFNRKFLVHFHTTSAHINMHKCNGSNR